MSGRVLDARTAGVNPACASVSLPACGRNRETWRQLKAQTAGVNPVCASARVRSMLRIESRLGSGGSGAVYKAWHKRLRKYVVVKEVKHDSSGDVQARRNEVEALKNLKCAYLPQVYDFLTDGNHSYTVLEFIRGESLDKLIGRKERFTAPQILKWYAQLASALEAIHQQNICHRDIKPANIMLTPEGDVCLIDFNAAMVGGIDTRLISRSPGYASPEQHEYFKRHTRDAAIIGRGYSADASIPGNGYTETQLLSEDSKTEHKDISAKRRIQGAALRFISFISL